MDMVCSCTPKKPGIEEKTSFLKKEADGKNSHNDER